MIYLGGQHFLFKHWTLFKNKYRSLDPGGVGYCSPSMFITAQKTMSPQANWYLQVFGAKEIVSFETVDLSIKDCLVLEGGVQIPRLCQKRTIKIQKIA